jgi:transposase-like protein
MHKDGLQLFRRRQFAGEIILLFVRRYLRFFLSYRNLEEFMAERSLSVWLELYMIASVRP